MSKIEIGRYSDLLRRALSMVGQVDIASELSPELSPTWQLEAATDEWEFLKGVKICSAAESVLANVGAAGQFVLRNPLDSGALAVVDEITFAASVNQDYVITVQTSQVDLVNTALSVVRDLRWPMTGVAGQAAMLPTFQNAVGAVPVGAGTIYFTRLLGNTLGIYTKQIILPPGTRVYFGGLNANVGVRFSIAWRERGVQPLEL
ncbi:hypothetical protein [Gilliamella sp. CG16]|uniref:hypothetical protein n=1 Tax=Gilliamella sp. CG16 TaxID=3351503 RepID=UPI003985C1CD